jgi:hypothetical protein
MTLRARLHKLVSVALIVLSAVATAFLVAPSAGALVIALAAIIIGTAVGLWWANRVLAATGN